MACGITKNGIICDNAGTSSHTGPHSGITTLWGYSLRVYWKSTDASVAVLKRALPGVYARNDQGVITPSGGTAQLTVAGMNLNTRHTCPGTWTRPTGWVARTGFDSTVITTDALEMNAAGNVIVHVKGDATPASFGGNVDKRLVKNGTVLQTWTGSATTETDSTFITSVVADDLLWVEFLGSGGFGASYVENNANTYIYTELA